MVALFSHTLRPAWEFTPGLPIWRLHPPVDGRIIGEVRNVETQRTCFFALTADLGRCIWRDREFHDPWWVGIERVTRNRLVLHGFEAPDSPVLRGATVVDITSGNILWSDAGWNGDEVSLLNTGVEVDGAGVEDSVSFPVMIDPRKAEETEKTVVAVWPVTEIVGGIELATNGNYTIAAAHLNAGGGDMGTLRHLLKIHDSRNGKVLYEDTIAASAKGIAPDAFFLHAGTLYYIRERKTLIAVAL
jgi:hypothetical protein